MTAITVTTATAANYPPGMARRVDAGVNAMKPRTLTWTLGFLALLGMLTTTACTQAGKHEVVGTLAGGALGAGTGAIIGNQSGSTGKGTAIGAGVGAIAGNMIGRGIDEASRGNEPSQPPAGYGYPTGGATYPPSTVSTPPGAPPPPPPPGHYEWDPASQRWIWRYNAGY